jgi:hypothetical protein
MWGNIRIDLKEVGNTVVDWIHLAQDSSQSSALGNIVMGIWAHRRWKTSGLVEWLNGFPKMSRGHEVNNFVIGMHSSCNEVVTMLLFLYAAKLYAFLFRSRNIWKTPVKQGFGRNKAFHLPFSSQITNLANLWTDLLLTYIPMARLLNENCDLKSLISASYFGL